MPVPGVVEHAGALARTDARHHVGHHRPQSAPVSYTHLDVYKRQEFTQGKCQFFDRDEYALLLKLYGSLAHLQGEQAGQH